MKLSDAEWKVMRIVWQQPGWQQPAAPCARFWRPSKAAPSGRIRPSKPCSPGSKKRGGGGRPQRSVEPLPPLVPENEARSSALRGFLERTFDGTLGALVTTWWPRKAVAPGAEGAQGAARRRSCEPGRRSRGAALMELAERLAMLLATFFWSQLAPLAIEAALLLLAAGLADRLLPRAVWPELRLAAGSVLLLKLVLPPAWTPPWPSPLSRLELPAGWSPGLPALNPAAHPDWRGPAISVAAVWLLGVAACLGLGIFRMNCLARIWRTAAPAGEELETLLRAAAGRLGLRRGPGLRIAEGSARPASSACCGRASCCRPASIPAWPSTRFSTSWPTSAAAT